MTIYFTADTHFGHQGILRKSIFEGEILLMPPRFHTASVVSRRWVAARKPTFRLAPFAAVQPHFSASRKQTPLQPSTRRGFGSRVHVRTLVETMNVKVAMADCEERVIGE